MAVICSCSRAVMRACVPHRCDHARFTVDFTMDMTAEASPSRMLAGAAAAAKGGSYNSSSQPMLVHAVSGKV